MNEIVRRLVRHRGKVLQDELAAALEQAHGFKRIFYDGMKKMGNIDDKETGFVDLYLSDQPSKQTAIEKAFVIFEANVHGHGFNPPKHLLDKIKGPQRIKGVCWAVMPEIITRQRSREVEFGTHKNYGDPYWCVYMRFKLI